MAASAAVQIKGMKELRRGLKHAPGNVNKTVKKAHREVTKIIIKAAPKAAARRGPSRGPSGSNRAAQRLARSFRNKPSVKGALVVSPLPDAFGQEFGAKRKRQFPAYSGFDSGQVGWRAVRENQDRIADEYLDSVMAAFKEAYPLRV